MRLRRLHPTPGTLTAAEAVAGLDLAALAPAHRPYLVLNMVATVDGRAAIAGRTAPMSSPADRQLFHALRTSADAVMVGSQTVREERYGRLVRDPVLRDIRAGRGLEPDPLAIVVSGRLHLPADLPLLQDPDSRVVVVTASTRSIDGCAASVEYLRLEDSEALDMAGVAARLRADHGVRSILCEGGPKLNATLLPAGLVDELFLSISPLLAGSAGSLSILDEVPLGEPLALELRWLLEAGGELFARYALQVSRTIG